VGTVKTIGQLANETGISRSTLRLYDRSGVFEANGIRVDRTGANYRLFPDDSVEKVKKIFESKREHRNEKLRARTFSNDIDGVCVPLIPGLSVNRVYIYNQRGGKTLTKGAHTWRLMATSLLEFKYGDLAKEYRKGTRVDVKIRAHFKECKPMRDLDNLHKIIGDAIKEATEIDDRHYNFIDLTPELNVDPPYIEIAVELEKTSALAAS
jgi:Holliday junction resolvase RusA-like endonuclease